VTIALAFDCANGPVLCADTQMTSDGGFKFEDSKILDAAQSYGWGIWGTYAGNPQLAQSVHTQLYEQLLKFNDKRPPQHRRVRETASKDIEQSVRQRARTRTDDLGVFGQRSRAFVSDRQTNNQLRERF